MVYFMSRLEHVSRLDIVWDQYFSNSLKDHTQKTRGEGTRRRVLENTVIPKIWAGFLHNSDNKKELFGFVAEKISKFNSGSKEIYTTQLEDVLTAYEPDNYINHVIMKKQTHVCSFMLLMPLSTGIRESAYGQSIRILLF